MYFERSPEFLFSLSHRGRRKEKVKLVRQIEKEKKERERNIVDDGALALVKKS